MLLLQAVPSGVSLGGPPVPHDEEVVMGSVASITHISARSEQGFEDAVRTGLERASQTLRHIDWFEVTQVRGQVKDGGVEHFQVGLKIGFRLEDD